MEFQEEFGVLKALEFQCVSHTRNLFFLAELERNKMK